MKVAIIQLCSGTEIAANIEACSEWVRAAAAQGAELIVTPEMTHLLQKDKASLLASIKSPEEDLAIKAFSALAKELDIDLLIGSLALQTGQKVSNRGYLFGPDGSTKAQYDKIHLFDAQVSDTEYYRESATYAAGRDPVIASAGDAKVGLSVCYDVRFPMLYRYYAQNGAQILSIPAAFTVPTGRAHWDILLRARAIETGSFVMAAAQGGEHEDGRKTYGHSKIINPWGDIVAELAHDKPGFVCADIDLGEVAKARQRIPAWSDRRDFKADIKDT